MDTFDSMKESHNQNMAIMDWAAKENPKAIIGYIRGNLSMGKFLILPSAIYSQCIALLKEHGAIEEEIAHVHERKFLSSHS